MHKSGKIEYEEDRLKWADFVTCVINHKTQYNIAKFTNFFQYSFKHTLQTLVGMLRNVSRSWWQPPQINSAEQH